MSEHTPTPWAFHRPTTAPAHNLSGRWVIVCQSKTKWEGVLICEMPYAATTAMKEAEQDANARFIVTAVNSHEAMKEAADGIVVFVEALCDELDIDPAETHIAVNAVSSVTGEKRPLVSKSLTMGLNEVRAALALAESRS